MINHVEIRGEDVVYIKNAPKYLLNGQRVKITETKILVTKEQTQQFFILIGDVELPVEAISRTYPIIRNGHKIPVKNKQIIIRP